jgi:cytochrome c-type biogenesis protein CcmH/NrfF
MGAAARLGERHVIALLPLPVFSRVEETVVLAFSRAVPPRGSSLLPDGEEARDWAERELSDPVYAASEPTIIDRVAAAIGEFLGRIFNPQVGEAWNPVLAVLVVLVIAALVAGAVLIWGRPRSAHRVAARSALLFGDDEQRTAGDLRAAAAAHAAAGDWDAAVADRFRAIARGMAERDILDAPPGTTAQGLARAAVTPFPRHAAELREAAAAFDDVRYLRRRGTAEVYAALTGLDEAIAAERPAPRAEVLAA